ncbi:MAG: flagellar motor switch protein FliN [Bryobacteraceae bacterium]|nr:flagellar motor switch protein FliN [Bryobacteraceae bacterium]MDW8380043.1 flagellar motor switch protein FliN [Bryobacterales bacterium]
MADSRILNEPARWLAETLALAIRQGLLELLGVAPSVEWAPRCQEAKGEVREEVWHEYLILPDKTSFWLGLTQEDSHALSQRVLATSGREDQNEPDSQTGWLALQNRFSTIAAQQFSGRLQRKIVVEASPQAISAPNFDCEIELTLSLSDWSGGIQLGWTSALEEWFDRESPPAVAGRPAPSAEDPGKLEGGRTLDLLLDVELPVSVSFGRAQLPLKEVLKLSSGSIVELNRSVNEPVEVIVNNCVVARGEVVVVEGNYGVRIKQIISKQERLRTLY